MNMQTEHRMELAVLIEVTHTYHSHYRTHKKVTPEP